MKYLRQLLIILIFSFAGEVLHYLIPIQIPASIYGLVLLFIALMTGLIQLPQVEETAKFLIEIMPMMFIPAGVGLLESWGVLKPILVPVIVILNPCRIDGSCYGCIGTCDTGGYAYWKIARKEG